MYRRSNTLDTCTCSVDMECTVQNCLHLSSVLVRLPRLSGPLRTPAVVNPTWNKVVIFDVTFLLLILVCLCVQKEEERLITAFVLIVFCEAHEASVLE